jgi:hypothetical protein
MPAIQFGKGFMTAARNMFHQHFIRRRCYSRLIKIGPNHTRQACSCSVDSGARRSLFLLPLAAKLFEPEQTGTRVVV